jgi:hypothetical protein
MRTAINLVVLGLLSTTAAAQPTTSPSKAPTPPVPVTQPAAPPAPSVPGHAVGNTLPLSGEANWPKLSWAYNLPSQNDAAGKVVVHWLCTPSSKDCKADLERIIALREAGGVYVIAYVNGSQRQAKRLDPIRESEGVGRGTVAYGPGVAKLMKLLGTKKGPYSIVVDVDGKVKAVTTSGDINELDARDTVVKSLVESVKPFTISNESTKSAKPNQKMTFTYKVQLANWLTFSQKTPMEFTFASSKEVKCDATTIKADKMKIEGHTLTAQVTCTAPKGSYQARGEIRFGYDTPTGGTGLGNDGVTWKFEVAP